MASACWSRGTIGGPKAGAGMPPVRGSNRDGAGSRLRGPIMPKEIIITATTAQLIRDLATPDGNWVNTSKLNPDGTLTVEIDDDVAEALAKISDDPEAAILSVLTGAEGVHRRLS